MRTVSLTIRCLATAQLPAMTQLESSCGDATVTCHGQPILGCMGSVLVARRLANSPQLAHTSFTGVNSASDLQRNGVTFPTKTAGSGPRTFNLQLP